MRHARSLDTAELRLARTFSGDTPRQRRDQLTRFAGVNVSNCVVGDVDIDVDVDDDDDDDDDDDQWWKRTHS